MFKSIAQITLIFVTILVLLNFAILTYAHTMGIDIMHGSSIPQCENDTDTTITRGEHITYQYNEILPGIGIQHETSVKLFGGGYQATYFCTTL